MEAITDFIFLGSNIIADGITPVKFRSKAKTNLDSVLKNRNNTPC